MSDIDRHLSELVAKVEKYGKRPNCARVHPSRCTPALIAKLLEHGLDVRLNDETHEDMITVFYEGES